VEHFSHAATDALRSSCHPAMGESFFFLVLAGRQSVERRSYLPLYYTSRSFAEQLNCLFLYFSLCKLFVLQDMEEESIRMMIVLIVFNSTV